MKRAGTFFPIALALVIAFVSSALGQDAREDGPRQIEKCQTISKPGSYKLVKNLTGPTEGDCLVITADEITIDLAGFTISASGIGATRAIVAKPPSTPLLGLAVRNGSISGFNSGVVLRDSNFPSRCIDNFPGLAIASIVEGLRVVTRGAGGTGINADGIVRGNTVTGYPVGIDGQGTVTGNYAVMNDSGVGIVACTGSTVIGNTVLLGELGISVFCPSNVTNNTVIAGTPLLFQGEGCSNTNNVPGP
jgi:hypothetical protein